MFMQDGDTDRDGVIAFEEFIHSYSELDKGLSSGK